MLPLPFSGNVWKIRHLAKGQRAQLSIPRFMFEKCQDSSINPTLLLSAQFMQVACVGVGEERCGVWNPQALGSNPGSAFVQLCNLGQLTCLYLCLRPLISIKVEKSNFARMETITASPPKPTHTHEHLFQVPFPCSILTVTQAMETTVSF
jgi:hypothetical protein